MKPQHAETVRIYYRNGRVSEFNNQQLAYRVWLALPHGIRAAFRGKGDARPVRPWDYADKP
jgi:hypothetical protein